MIKKLRLFLAVLASAGAFMVPSMALAAEPTVTTTPNITGSLCNGAKNLQLNDSVTGTGDCNDTTDSGTGGLNQLISKIINIISVIVAVVAVIMIIVGGFKYIASGGDSNKITGAKNTILYAIIGLVIVALAQFVVKFVLSKATTAVGSGTPTP